MSKFNRRAGPAPPLLALAVLLVTLATIATIPLTFAKYAASGTATASATVAKWGPSVSVKTNTFTGVYYIRKQTSTGLTTAVTNPTYSGAVTLTLNNTASEVSAQLYGKLRRKYNTSDFTATTMFNTAPALPTTGSAAALTPVAAPGGSQDISALSNPQFKYTYETPGYSSTGAYRLGFYEKLEITYDAVQVD